MSCDCCLTSDNVTRIVIAAPDEGWSKPYELCGNCTAKLRDIGMFGFSLAD